MSDEAKLNKHGICEAKERALHAELARLRAENERLADRIVERSREVEDLRAEIGRLEKFRGSQRKEIAALRARVAELEAKKANG
jgi:chromosome segregation ATPase